MSWMLVIWMAGSNPPMVEFAYYDMKHDCTAAAELIVEADRSGRDAFCLLTTESWKRTTLNF